MRFVGVHVLVVDDSSPDGTGDRQMVCCEGRSIHALHRTEKDGHGRLPRRSPGDGIVTTRCSPRWMPTARHGARAVATAPFDRGQCWRDLAIGSCYVAGGSTVNWPKRRELSRAARQHPYARLALGPRSATSPLVFMQLTAA